MVKVLIFAGGTGQRMNTRSKPKQFLELHGKPIIIYTIEHFEYHNDIDEIVIVCLDNWISELNGYLKRYDIRKVKRIIPGGDTGHDSIFNGLLQMKSDTKTNDIILIHDGVRHLITEELITANIMAVREHGTAITVEPARESIVQSFDGININNVSNRNQMYIAKAPQSFYYGFIYDLYNEARIDKKKSIDSAHLLSLYNKPMFMVQSTKNNIKITEPADYYILRALYEASENQQIYGL